jgi:hypothetical protein
MTQRPPAATIRTQVVLPLRFSPTVGSTSPSRWATARAGTSR